MWIIGQVEVYFLLSPGGCVRDWFKVLGSTVPRRLSGQIGKLGKASSLS